MRILSSPISVVQNQAVPQALQAQSKPSQSPIVALDQLQLHGHASKIPAVAIRFNELPPIEVVKRGNYTWSRNVNRVQITQIDYPDGKYFMVFSGQGQAMMMRQHDDKRDTLNFSDMNPNVGPPRNIPNVFFHLQGEGVSKIEFDKNHDVVVSLSNGEQLILDAKDGQTVKQGPFSIRFFPDQAGENFNVIYTGLDKTVQRYRSKGDSVKW